MNYIKHLTAFFEKVSQDYELNPTHISLYMAFFQSWNYNRFQNPIAICRSEMMRVSKIASFATYHKCIKDLDAKGYIKYEPSYNPFKGSLVHIIDLTGDLKNKKKSNKRNSENNQVIKQPTEQLESEQELNKPCTSDEQVVNKHNTSPVQALVSYINNNKHYKHNKLYIGETKKNNVEFSIEKNEKDFLKNEFEKKKKLRQKKENVCDETSSSKAKPQSLQEVQNFFLEKQATSLEAERFFNYFESNGWLVGGKTKMKDWKAAARNWLLNANKFHLRKENTKPNHLHVSNEKNYGEPL